MPWTIPIIEKMRGVYPPHPTSATLSSLWNNNDKLNFIIDNQENQNSQLSDLSRERISVKGVRREDF